MPQPWIGSHHATGRTARAGNTLRAAPESDQQQRSQHARRQVKRSHAALSVSSSPVYPLRWRNCGEDVQCAKPVRQHRAASKHPAQAPDTARNDGASGAHSSAPTLIAFAALLVAAGACGTNSHRAALRWKRGPLSDINGTAILPAVTDAGAEPMPTPAAFRSFDAVVEMERRAATQACVQTTPIATAPSWPLARSPEAIFENITAAQSWQQRVALARPFVASGLLHEDIVTAKLQADLQKALIEAGITSPQTQRRVYSVAEHQWQRELRQPRMLSDLGGDYIEDLLPALNFTRLAQRHPQPLEILRIVHFRHGASMQDIVTDDYRLQEAVDASLVEEAALVYERVSLTTQSAPDTPVATLTQTFKTALKQQLATLRTGYLLLPSSAPEEPGPWFDGMAVRDAQDRTVGALADALAQNTARLDRVRTQCAKERIAWTLPVDDTDATQKRIEALLRQRLEELAENTDYPFGSPLQSIATVLTRMGPAHGICVGDLRDASAMIEEFNRLTSDWKDKKVWPVDPLLVTAAHLLTASTPYEVVGNASALNALLNDDNDATNTTRSQLLDRLRETFEHRLHAYDPLPFFDETKATETILTTRFDFSRDELYQPIFATFYVGAPSRLGLGSTTSTPVGHFLHSVKTRYPFFFDRTPGRLIDAYPLMKNEMDRFNEKLERCREVPAKIDELIRLAGVENSTDARASALKFIIGMNNRNARAESLNSPFWFSCVEAAYELASRLVISPPIFYVVEQAREGNWQAVAEMVPFLVPTWEIGEGLVRRNFTEFSDGVIGLGVDALVGSVTHIAGRLLTRRMEQAFIETMRMPPSRRSAMSMLNVLSEPLAEQGSDANVESISLVNFDLFASDSVASLTDSPTSAVDPYDAFVDSAQLPQSIRRLPSIKRLTETGSNGARTEPSFELTFNEDLEIFATQTPPIEPIVPSPPHTHLSAMALEQQPTVIDLKRWVDGPRRASINDVMRVFYDYVAARTPLTGQVLSKLVTSTSEAGKNVIAQLEAIAEKSPTFRAIINRASLPENGQPWKLEVAEGFAPKVLPDAGRIWLCTDAEFARKHYQTHSGLTEFAPERGWLHECLHALTDLKDPVDATQHRGAIVYLTDRIGFEAGWRYEERVIYRSSSGSSVTSSEHSSPSGAESPITPVSDEVVTRMHDENRYLDRILDRQMNLRPSTHALTPDISSRATVADGLRLEQTLRFERLWVTSQANPLTSPDVRAPGRLLGTNTDLLDVSHRLYLRSRLYRFLYHRWMPGDSVGQWRIVTRTEAEMSSSSQGATRAPWRINRALGEIEMHSGPVYYLSRSGPRYMTMTHRTVGALTELITGDLRIRAVVDANVERGLPVVLENALMQHAHDNVRISSAYAREPGTLLEYTTRANRIARIEDRELRGLTRLLKVS